MNHPSLSEDTASVRATNDDAQISKMACVRLKYFQDDYIRHFVKRHLKRSPLINRGYYSRIAALRQLLRGFLQTPDIIGPRQVLSLGAGFDTIFFQLQANGCAPNLYVELDFPEVTSRKAAIVASEPNLQRCIPRSDDDVLDTEGGRIITKPYCLLPVDLRQPAAMEAALKLAKLQHDVPTYIIAECVLVYMRPAESNTVVRWLAEHLQQAAFVLYEQIKPHDAFGQQMMTNLQSRGCPLLGIYGTPDLQAHEQRFVQNGWHTACARDMNAIYNKHTDPEDRQRIERLEMLDEFEEWTLIQGHYCIVIATKDSQQRLHQIVDLPTFPESKVVRRPLLAA
ncbi:hypothetical protein WJX74_001902 [Apatococcus lobatus]|uniref:Leucine carboxyl methyltransferase 1 homolog n=1 Tax=Apatococcus lobatus TaxID=904363 RepID=A0AAW1RC54_9CHLO